MIQRKRVEKKKKVIGNPSLIVNYKNYRITKKKTGEDHEEDL